MEGSDLKPEKLRITSNHHEELLHNVKCPEWTSWKGGSLVSTIKRTAERTGAVWDNNVKCREALERAEECRVVHATDSMNDTESIKSCTGEKAEEARSKAEDSEREREFSSSPRHRVWRHLQHYWANASTSCPREPRSTRQRTKGSSTGSSKNMMLEEHMPHSGVSSASSSE